MFGKIINEDTYQGIQLYKDSGPYIESRLADSLATLKAALEDSPSVTMYYLELKVNENTNIDVRSSMDEPVVQLVESLLSAVHSHDEMLREDYLESGRQLKEQGKPIIDAVWQQVFNDDGSACYHVILLLNHSAFDTQVLMYIPDIHLKNRIKSAWGNIMELSSNDINKFVSIPIHPTHIYSNRSDYLASNFPFFSKLCRLPTQANPKLLPSGFGTTRSSRNKKWIV